MTILSKAQIIGPAIRQVHAQYRLDDDGCDQAWSWITLENGVSFSLPVSSENHFTFARVPETAGDFPRRDRKQFIGQRIVRVHRRVLVEDDDAFESIALELSDGLFITERTVAPSGIHVGLVIQTLEQWRAANEGSRWVPFWAP